MKFDHTEVKIYSILLDEQEAKWLKDYMQNPAYHVAETAVEECRMRKEIFDGLTAQGVK